MIVFQIHHNFKCAIQSEELKVLLLNLFIYFNFWLHSIWDPSFPAGDWTCTLCIVSAVLTTGLPGKFQKILLSKRRVNYMN